MMFLRSGRAEASSLPDITLSAVSGIWEPGTHIQSAYPFFCVLILLISAKISIERELNPVPIVSPALVFDPGRPHVPPPSSRNATVRHPFRVSQGCAAAEGRAGWGKTTTSFRNGGRDIVCPSLLPATREQQKISRTAV